MLADRVLGRRLAVFLGLALTAQLGQATPPRARALVFEWYSGCSYGAITTAPWVAGWLRDATGDLCAPLLFAASLSLAGLISYAVMQRAAAPPARPIRPTAASPRSPC